MHSACHILTLCGIDTHCCSHLFGNLKTVLAKVGDHHVPRSGKLADGCRHCADEARSGDEHILAKQGEGESRMGGVAERVHNCHEIVGDPGVHLHYIRSRDTQVLCKGSVAVYSHSD